MKKISKILTGTLCAMVISMGAAMAEPTFTPLNFDDSSAVKPATTKTTTSTSANPKSGLGTFPSYFLSDATLSNWRI